MPTITRTPGTQIVPGIGATGRRVIDGSRRGRAVLFATPAPGTVRPAAVSATI